MVGKCHLAKYWGVKWGRASDDTLNLVLKCEDTCESFHCPVGNNSPGWRLVGLFINLMF